MRRIRLKVSYDGTAYAGWQVQPGQSTIQGELERVLAEIEGKPVRVLGSGRTDAGVHALEQVAVFDLENPIPLENLRHAVNRLLSRDIRVFDAVETHPDFHPRHHARAKTYRYTIWRAEICPPMRRLYVAHFPYPLDEDAMSRCARLCEGEHDFTAFAAADEKDALGHSKVRTVYSSTLQRVGDELVYTVRGSGFLKHMVRMMVGTLVEAGKGNVDEQAFRARLEPGFPGKAGRAMPASGLCLISVEYEHES